MKKSSAIVFTLLGLSGLAGQAQAASSGTISFSGTVTETTCDVLVNGQGANASVMLPTISTKQLSDPSTGRGRTAFKLQLKGCEGSLKYATAYFEPGSNVDSNGRLRNLGGSAKNVVLQLRDGSVADNPVIVAGDISQLANASYQNITGGTATMEYLVEYLGVGTLSAGTVVSNVVYSLHYK
ncbi:TPA: type 1 fimbrial protein [Serratia marcescens]|jgi:major type 1 subunit fimbrin (pilin)|uniref:Fimbrial protein n=1 Tax=Serratia marcescens TaxID=615 RepID=A0AAP8TN51_SERMA|nr:fimbrial protein [Serratia marcescens]MBH2528592.1 type 1 fimbrial protein [Serratia marcescens]MBH2880178.1 type 1 fimbrial protein [Serratia marcescens]MBH2887449.1 type 1 fimbrial protein [Serratia marcescens]MBH3000084.1 type 1 fimbrial protein [Serratia marcescens]MBN5207013.1 type 1 fimbrial protein [Serratia marcescens]